MNMSSNIAKKGILELLREGPVVGDGSMCMTLEKRGYSRSGVWTPEAVITHPYAVQQLLREYQRAGADVLQTPCFFSSDERLEIDKNRGGTMVYHTVSEINNAACTIAKQVASEGENTLVCGALSPVMSYLRRKDMEAAKREFHNQLKVFLDHDVDFLLGEFFAHVEELELCVEVMKSANKPIACTMKIGPLGDFDDVSVEDCAIRMARTGADIIGLNCYFDINTTLKVLKRMKAALDKEGLTPYLMCQPLGFLCPEVEGTRYGYLALKEAPFGMESRQLTRSEVHKFTRAAYDLGVRYIGGCCGMEPHHIRAVAQELIPERKRIPPVQDTCPPHGGLMADHQINSYRMKSTKDYWLNIKPCSGRPDCQSVRTADEILDCQRIFDG